MDDYFKLKLSPNPQFTRSQYLTVRPNRNRLHPPLKRAIALSKENTLAIARPLELNNQPSQDCPSCSKRVKKSLSTRTYVCECGYSEDRDIAASINILNKGLCTAGHVGTYATGDLPSWASGANLLSNCESLNVESPTKIKGEAIAESVI